MNIQDLNTFETAARMGSVTKAAKSLSTVQSNVTARIRVLEDELGAQLFHRSHSGISLTRKGQELLPYAQEMIVLMQKAKEAVSGRDVQGVLRIGSLQTTAMVRLPGLLRVYLDRYKEVDIAVETGTSAELVEKVLDHSVDGAFMAGAPLRSDLDTMVAYVEELVMVTPLEFETVEEYLKKGPIPKVLVFRAGCSYRQTLERYLSKKGADLLNEMEFGTLEGIIGCVGAGLGVTMLPRLVVERSGFRDQVRVHTLPNGVGLVETLFVTHRTKMGSSALEGLKEVIATGVEG